MCLFHNQDHGSSAHNRPGAFRTPLALILVLGLAPVLLYFLWSEYRAQLIALLPLGALLLCPLLHGWMHRSHDNKPPALERDSVPVPTSPPPREPHH